jgi:SAM-dependent methyltransferase
VLSETDWDLVWRHERLHRRREPVDFRRWKRASQRALRELFPGEGVRVLDATAGLGDHTVNLAELGFEVEACDASAEARDATHEALRAAGLAERVVVFDARWEALGETRAARYDLIFHDAIHWIEDEDAMHRALVGLRGALAPGGALVFFFADPEQPEEGAGMRILDWDREHIAPRELAWDHETDDGGRVTHVRVAAPAERHVDEHLLYLVRDARGRARLESTAMRRIYRWDWHAMRGALARAGYGEVIGRHFVNDKGHTFAMSLAHRPR